MKDKDYFYNLMLEKNEKNKKHRGYSEYGSRVMDLLDLFESLEKPEEITSFQKALEKLLLSGNPELVEFGVAICTGFVVFKSR
jgi:hypothetical protein